MFIRLLSSLVTTVAVAIRRAIEGEAPLREARDPLRVDCLDCKQTRTFLHRGRTMCCASAQFVHAAKVKGRESNGVAGEVFFR